MCGAASPPQAPTAVQVHLAHGHAGPDPEDLRGQQGGRRQSGGPNAAGASSGPLVAACSALPAAPSTTHRALLAVHLDLGLGPVERGDPAPPNGQVVVEGAVEPGGAAAHLRRAVPGSTQSVPSGTVSHPAAATVCQDLGTVEAASSPCPWRRAPCRLCSTCAARQHPAGTPFGHVPAHGETRQGGMHPTAAVQQAAPPPGKQPSSHGASSGLATPPQPHSSSTGRLLWSAGSPTTVPQYWRSSGPRKSGSRVRPPCESLARMYQRTSAPLVAAEAGMEAA